MQEATLGKMLQGNLGLFIDLVCVPSLEFLILLVLGFVFSFVLVGFIHEARSRGQA